MIAVDSSVLVDVLTADERFGESSMQSLTGALAADEVVVCDAVVAEVQLLLDTPSNVMEALSSMGIRYEATAERAAVAS